MSLAEKRQRAMQTRSRLPLDERCKLMSISRSGIYYKRHFDWDKFQR